MQFFNRGNEAGGVKSSQEWRASSLGGGWSVFSEKFLGVFDEADENDDGGAGEADEEHDLEEMHGE